MNRTVSTALISAALAFGGASSVRAQNVIAVERSGNTFHVAVCPGPAGPGTARCHAHIVTDRAGNPVVHNAAPNITPYGLSPAMLRAAYKVTTTGSAASVVVIVDAYGYDNAETDLNVYRAQFGMTACTTANGCFRKLNQNGLSGNYPRQNTGWAQETALDLDMASAMCPGCKIVLVEASSANFNNLATAENTAARIAGVVAISNSYGGGESGSSGYESAYSHPNIAITVSSGDSGYGVQFPASSPHVTAVGGTSLMPASNSRGWAETAWSGAGSGCSAIYAKPSWQTDTGCGRRTVADVSAVADPNTGVAVYGPGFGGRSGWLVFGGTSVAAPLIAGIYGNLGAAAFYGSDPYAHTSALYDVTSGSNGSCGGSYLCTAGPAYDGPTGLGTPNGVSGF